MSMLDRLVGIFGLVFAAAIAVRVILVRRRTGKSPVVAGFGRSAHDQLHGALGAIIAIEAVSIALFRLEAYRPDLDFYRALLPIDGMRTSWIEAGGLVLACAGLAIAVRAQIEMGRNWRVGNDEGSETELVRSGLFACSRNPIYVGFIAISTGLFLAMPNAATLVCAVLNPFVLSRIIRLEEDFQRARHGEAFDDYAAKVRRWL